MCGIAGVVTNGTGAPASPALVQRMCALIRHRGPDEEGYYNDGLAALGMRRLSIIDVSGGHQPVTNEDGTVWAVFNGEIYNFRQLRSQLESAGHVFTSSSDTETIVHAYEVYGDKFPAYLHGMFSVALWDTRRRRLLLARDRFGKKPLFYALLPSGLIFASELKCLLLHPEFKRVVDPAALDEYLAWRYVPAPRTIFAAACKLRAAHVLSHEMGEVRVQAYWSLPPRQTSSPLSGQARIAAAAELELLIEEAVAKRLVSDVPLGAFLSGGLDSSVVVALMARLTREPVKTFTIGFDDSRFNEAPAARRTARALGTQHQELVVRPDLVNVLPTIVWGMDEPQSDSSAVPTYYVSQLARQHVTVCLTGDGGDEAFAGYDRYRQALAEGAYDRLPIPVRALAGRVATLLPPGVRGKRRLVRVASPWTDRYSLAMSVFDQHERATLYRSEWREALAALQPASHLERLLSEHSHPDVLSAVQWTDIHSYLTDDILAKVDRMSMINSLETRAPLLDHELIEFVFRLPSSAFHDGEVSKLLFRDVARRLLPAELLERPKSGFGIPQDDWLRGPLRTFVREVLLSDSVERRGWFRRAEVERLIREHDTPLFSHGSRLWSLLTLELWAQQFLDTSPTALHAPVETSPTFLLPSHAGHCGICGT
jgi:asparagine synthase (glutamine-hydrolysing)